MTLRSPFRKQEPQMQRQRMVEILRLLTRAQCDARNGSTILAKAGTDEAMALLQAEMDRLLPPLPREHTAPCADCGSTTGHAPDCEVVR